MSPPSLPDPELMWRAKYRVVFPYIRNFLGINDLPVFANELPKALEGSEHVKVGLLNPNPDEVRFRMYFRRWDGSCIRRLSTQGRLWGNSSMIHSTANMQLAEPLNAPLESHFDQVGWMEIFSSEKVSASAYLYGRQEQSDAVWATGLQGQHWYLRKSVVIDERDLAGATDSKDPVKLPLLPTRVSNGSAVIALSASTLMPLLKADQTQITFIVRPEQTVRRAAIVAQNKLESTAVDRVINLVLPNQMLVGANIELRRDPSFQLVETIPIQPEDASVLTGRTLYIEWLAG